MTIEITIAKRMKYLLVIPVLNEENNLFDLLMKIEKDTPFHYLDILFVDGGSTDRTIDLINNANFEKKILIYSGSQQLSGQLQMGYKYSLEKNYKGVITMDGNNKDDPFFLPRFIGKLNEGYDFVQGSRFIKGGKSINLPLFRNIMVNYVHVPLMNFMSNYKFTDTTQGYRAYSQKILLDKRIGLLDKSFKRYQLLLCATTLAPKYNHRCVEVPNTRTYSLEGGQTKFDLRSLILYFFDIVIYSIIIKFRQQR